MQKHSEKSQTNWAKIDAMREEEIERLADEDDQALGVEWDNAHIMVVMPERKEHINLRLDAEIVRFFRKQGPGYQTRINAVLRAYMHAQHTNNASDQQSRT